MTVCSDVDLRGLKCPSPLVKLNDVILNLSAGDEFVAVADDDAFEHDIQAWCELTRNTLLQLSRADDGIRAHIRKST